jgi:D-serine deaminase-like pyridoxal phosphate-dependent protein
MSLPALQALALKASAGHPACLVDLAALDANLKVVLDWAKANGRLVRPALKVTPSAQLSAYILQRLPEPRALIFSLRALRDTLPRAPQGTDFLMGYPPTPRELAEHLALRPARTERPHRLRILVDSLTILKELAALAGGSKRRLPLEVAIELDVGMGRGGMKDAAELRAALQVLREAKDRLRLTAVLGYDGHATLNGDATYRKLVAETAQDRYAAFLSQLSEEGAGLYDPRDLVRNGPASSNYRNWTRPDVANEISPGSALLYAGYLGGFDNEGLTPAVALAAPVFRITSDFPSVPLTQATLPGANREEINVRTLPWSDSGASPVYPDDIQTDELSGGGWAYHVPKGVLKLGDQVLFRPQQTGEAMVPFGAIHAVREGSVRRVWPTLPRPQAPVG